MRRSLTAARQGPKSAANGHGWWGIGCDAQTAPRLAWATDPRVSFWPPRLPAVLTSLRASRLLRARTPHFGLAQYSIVCSPCSIACQPCSAVCQPCSTVCQPRSTVCQPCSTVCQPCSTVCPPCSTVCPPCSTVCQPCSTVCQPCSTVTPQKLHPQFCQLCRQYSCGWHFAVQ